MEPNDIYKLALKYDIKLNDNEVIGIYNYIRNNCDKYLSNPNSYEEIIFDLKNILSDINYEKALILYNKNKDKF